MANFDSTNDGVASPQAFVIGTKLSILGLSAATATLTQGCLIDVSFSQSSSPSTNDGPIVWTIDAGTTLGTGTTLTPSPAQPGWRASGAVGKGNYTANPTLTTKYYSIAINQRASYRWMPVPGSEIYWPATNLAGLVISGTSITTTGYTGNGVASCTHTE